MPNPFGAVDWQDPVEWDHPLNRGLVSWWLVGDENPFWGGPILRDLCGKNHGTLTNFTAGGDHWGTPGPNGFGALKFDGSDDYVLGSRQLTELGATWTVTSWLRDDTGTGARTVLCHDDGSVQPTFYWRYGANSGTYAGGSYEEITLTAPSVGVWVWESLVYDGANLRHYRNGVDINSVAATGTPANGVNYRLTSGALLNIQFWPGKLTDQRVYSQAKSPAEVAALYEQSLRGHPDTLRRFPRARHFVPQANVFTGSGSLTTQAATTSGSGAVGTVGSGAPATEAATCSGQAIAGCVGTGSLSIPVVTCAGTGAVILSGTGSLAAIAAILVGSGTMTGLDVSATGALAAAQTLCSGSGTASGDTVIQPGPRGGGSSGSSRNGGRYPQVRRAGPVSSGRGRGR